MATVSQQISADAGRLDILVNAAWGGYERMVEAGQFVAAALAAGRVLTVMDRSPAEVHYAVHCGDDRTTPEALVHIVQGVSTRRLHLRRDERDHWWQGERRIPHLDGILDVDLAISPSTNTLPIRRMALAIGEFRPSAAAWVGFPELICERLAQCYTRLGDLHYRYDSNAGAFTTDIRVDEPGVVIRYGDIWERVAAT